jgi:hypothetical protein
MLPTDVDRVLKGKVSSSYEMITASVAKGCRKRGVGWRNKQSKPPPLKRVFCKKWVFLLLAPLLVSRLLHFFFYFADGGFISLRRVLPNRWRR